MKVKQIMTSPAIHIHPDENVAVAVRTLAQYNIGALPVCDNNGTLCGVVTDRDLVTRCIAAERSANATTVGQVMTHRVLSVGADMDVGVAAHLMGRQQIRRLPVTENGRLCGMVSLGDIACREDTVMDAADALQEVSSNISDR